MCLRFLSNGVYSDNLTTKNCISKLPIHLLYLVWQTRHDKQQSKWKLESWDAPAIFAKNHCRVSQAWCTGLHKNVHMVPPAVQHCVLQPKCIESPWPQKAEQSITMLMLATPKPMDIEKKQNNFNNIIIISNYHPT